MSVKMALAKLCACTCGGAIIGGGAIGAACARELALIGHKVLVIEPGTVVRGAANVTIGKPDPQVFLAAAARLGVPPDRCVVVEDAVAYLHEGEAAGTVRPSRRLPSEPVPRSLTRRGSGE